MKLACKRKQVETMKITNPTGKGGFRKGVSGNPSGRKAENPEVKAYALEKSFEAMQKIYELMQSEDPRTAMAAAKEILDRALGRAPQAVEVSGKSGPFIAGIYFGKPPESE